MAHMPFYRLMTFDQMALLIPLFMTVALTGAKNPHEKGTDKYQALRLCRIGLVLTLWSFESGLVGCNLAVAAFILGVVGVVKGRTWRLCSLCACL